MPSLHHSLVSYIEYPCSFTVDFSSVPKREYPNLYSRPASIPVKEIQMSKNSQVMSCHQNTDMDLLFFSSIDEATKMWLDTLHRMWALCKHLILPFSCNSSLFKFSLLERCIKCTIVSIAGKKCDGVSKTLTDYFETAPNPYLSTLRILANISDFDHMTNSKSLAFAGLFFKLFIA